MPTVTKFGSNYRLWRVLSLAFWRYSYVKYFYEWGRRGGPPGCGGAEEQVFRRRHRPRPQAPASSARLLSTFTLFYTAFSPLRLGPSFLTPRSSDSTTAENDLGSPTIGSKTIIHISSKTYSSGCWEHYSHTGWYRISVPSIVTALFSRKKLWPPFYGVAQMTTKEKQYRTTSGAPHLKKYT